MKRRIHSVWLMVALALVVAACSSGGATTTTSGSGEFGPGIEGADEYGERYDPDPDLVTQALGTTENVPPIVMASIYRAGIEPSEEQITKALECFNAGRTACSTGTGGPLTMGVADGGRGNVWRQVTHMEAILQALTYPEIGTIISTDAQWAGPDEPVADMRYLIQSDVDFIIGYPDWGTVLAEVVLEAEAAGIPYIPYSAGWVGLPGDRGYLTPGVDYLTIVGEELCELGESFAQVLNDNIDTGTVGILGGTPGNALSRGWQRCLQASLDDTRIDQKGPADTFWDNATARQVVQGWLAEGDIAGYAYEYADGLATALQDTEIDDLVIAVRTDEPTLFCDWVARDNPNYRIFYSAGGNFQSRTAVTAAMMHRAGATIPAQLIVPHVMREVTADDCDQSDPAKQVSNTSLVPQNVLERMFG